MKVGITGNTGAIGSEIEKLLTEKNISVKGFTRSSGYCIIESRDKIIMELDDCDVFINLANAEFAATELLVDLFEEWQDERKLIINVGSAIADYADMRQDLALYAAQKSALKKAAKVLNHVDAECEVKYVSFGYVDTPKMRAKYPEAKDMMSTEEVAKIVCSLISNL